jgi:malonyl-CoA O-methyltransferase
MAIPLVASETPVPGLDPVAAARWQNHRHAQTVWLNQEVGERMADRLSWIKRTPTRWMDWAPLWGGEAVHQLLKQRYPQSVVLWGGAQMDETSRRLSPRAGWTGLWRRWTQDAPLPQLGWQVPEPAVDMVWANMALHLTPHPQALLRHWLDCLAVDGFLMFSCLGPDSLQELREVHAASGWPAPAHPYTDMHDWGDMLVAAGFAEPVMDMERLTLTYTTLGALEADLRVWGRNLSAQRFPACRGKQWRQHWLTAMERGLPRNRDGAYTLTLEVVYGHAMRGTPKVALEPTASVSVDQMRAMLRHPRR